MSWWHRGRGLGPGQAPQAGPPWAERRRACSRGSGTGTAADVTSLTCGVWLGGVCACAACMLANADATCSVFRSCFVSLSWRVLVQPNHRRGKLRGGKIVTRPTDLSDVIDLSGPAAGTEDAGQRWERLGVAQRHVVPTGPSSDVGLGQAAGVGLLCPGGRDGRGADDDGCSGGVDVVTGSHHAGDGGEAAAPPAQQDGTAARALQGDVVAYTFPAWPGEREGGLLYNAVQCNRALLPRRWGEPWACTLFH